jgi:hypothetical protein
MHDNGLGGDDTITVDDVGAYQVTASAGPGNHTLTGGPASETIGQRHHQPRRKLAGEVFCGSGDCVGRGDNSRAFDCSGSVTVVVACLTSELVVVPRALGSAGAFPGGGPGP